MTTRTLLLLPLALAGLLAACGGGSSNATGQSGVATGSATAPPASATAAPSPSGTPAASTAGLARCHTAGLSAKLTQSNGAAGTIAEEVQLTNTSGAPCQLYGYPGMQLLDGAGHPITTTVVRGGGMLNPPGPTLFTVGAGGFAYFEMEYSDVNTGPSACPQAAKLEITPPDETTFLTIAYPAMPCNNGTYHVSPVHPNPSPQLQ